MEKWAPHGRNACFGIIVHVNPTVTVAAAMARAQRHELRRLNAGPGHAALRLGAPPRQKAVLRAARGRALADPERALALHCTASVVIRGDIARCIVVKIARARVAQLEVGGPCRRERLRAQRGLHARRQGFAIGPNALRNEHQDAAGARAARKWCERSRDAF